MLTVLASLLLLGAVMVSTAIITYASHVWEPSLACCLMLDYVQGGWSHTDEHSLAPHHAAPVGPTHSDQPTLLPTAAGDTGCIQLITRAPHHL